MADITTITLFSERNESYRSASTVIVFGVTRGGTSMVAGAMRGFGYHLGTDLAVNQEDQSFYFKTGECMRRVINDRNSEHFFWGWKYPMAAEYVERIFSGIRNPLFIIVSRDVVATAASLVRWDDREPSGAIAEAVMQTQKNIMLAVRLRVPTLLVSYEKASLNRDGFLTETEVFLGRPLIVDRQNLLTFMVPGSYKSYEEIVLSAGRRD